MSLYETPYKTAYLVHYTHMKKDTLVGIGALVLIIGGLIAYALVRPLPHPAESIADTSNLPEGSYIDHAKYYDIATNYATSTPLALSVGASANASAVALMKNFVASTIEQFKTDGKFANLTSNDIKVMGLDQGRKESLTVVYLMASSPHTVSYIYTVYEDTLGAHGNTVFKTFTFDTRTGKELHLSDLFVSADYLTVLSQMSKDMLTSQLGNMSVSQMIASGTTPDEKNFQNFFFDNESFVLLFPPYQVAPYAAGPQTVPFSASSLRNILRPEYR
jgi:hypothetical protein